MVVYNSQNTNCSGSKFCWQYVKKSDLEFSDTEINCFMLVGTDRSNLTVQSLQVDTLVDLLATTKTVYSCISKAYDFLVNKKKNSIMKINWNSIMTIGFAKNY